MLVVVAAGCTQHVPRIPVADEVSLDLDAKALHERGAPKALLDRMRRDAFTYFRMLAEPYELRVCNAFADLIPELPITAVEGDAHVAQFAVTSDSYGLDDFDRGGFGPPVVDLVRYAASLHIACRQATFPCDGEASVERLLAAYRTALLTPGPSREPRVVSRMRGRASTRKQWLAMLQGQWSLLDATIEREVRAVWADYVRKQAPGALPPMTSILAIGAIHTGVGSTTARRALLRIGGATENPEDDLIIEVRRGARSPAQSCVWRGPPSESITLLAMSLVRRDMPAMHGFVLGTAPAWIQSWDPSYVELSLRDLASQRDLDELAVDAAHQLAGHTWSSYPDRLQATQRRAQLAAFDRTHARVATTAHRLADETIAAWTRFARD